MEALQITIGLNLLLLFFIFKISKRINLLAIENKNLNDENNSLKSKFKEIDEIRKKLEIDFSLKEKDFLNLNETLSKLQKDHHKLFSETKKLEEDFSTKKQDCIDLREELNTREDEYRNLTTKLNELQSQKTETANNLEIKINDLNELSEKYNYIESRYRLIANDIDEAVSLTQKLSTLKEEITHIDLQKNNLENEYSAGRERYQSLISEIAVLEERLEIYSFGLYEPHFSFDTSDSYKEAALKFYDERKKLIKDDLAAKCSTTWTVNGSKVEGRKQTRHYTKIMLRAFNGECDSALLKVKWNNVKSMEERIKKSFEAINNLGESHDIKLTEEYLQIRLKELWLTHEYQEKLHEEREEQRRIREQIREEERAIREMEAARQEAEKEEARYKKALEKAHQEINGRFGDERKNLENKIAELEINLQKAQELKERAISMAQITKAGFVYIISNIGSFGDNVFKIGMTRRLEPTDRVRELSGASVPFPYDVHAMIYSQNAPELENNFHKKFKYKRLNLVNGRKEFFNVTLQEITDCAAELNHEIQITKLAEARDYRETLAIRSKIDPLINANNINNTNIEIYPEKLFENLDRQNLIDIDEENENLV